MTKKYSTKKALVASVLMLALCFSMLIGTTFAWFTDSVTSANNIIKAGNLDIEVYYAYPSDVENGKIADDAWKLMTADAPVFDNEALWEPGYTQLVYFKIKNVGSLAAKYQFRVDILNEVAGTNVYGQQFKISDNIQTYVNACTNRNLFESYCIYTERDIATNPPGAPNPFYTSLANAADGTLANDEGADSLKLNHELTLRPADEWDSELYATLCLWMPSSVGNEANFLTGTTPPEINLGITVVATQYTYENDSFDNKYDEGAAYFENVSEAVEVPANATSSATLTTDEVSVDVPAALLRALPNDVTSISLGYTEPKSDTTNKTITFDSIEFVDQNGKEIDVSALSSTEKITITLPVADVFADGEAVTLYHDGEIVASAVVENGFVTYEANHFCEVSIVDATKIYDYVVEDLAGLTTAFANGGKVLLINDIKFEKILPVEPGAEVYLDMNGKKITVNQSTKSNTLIYVKDGAKLVIDGNGTIDLEGVSTMAIFAPYGELVIENGTFVRDEVTTITSSTTGLFMGAKTVNSNVTINGGYFDAGYYDKNAADIEAILAGEKELSETADDIAKRNNSYDANLVRVALKDNISAVLNHSGYGTFAVYGGTFVGMNPAWGDEGSMLPTSPDYLRPWSYYQGAFLDGQTFNADGIVLPDGYAISMVANEAGVPVYTVTYSK